MPLVRRAKVGNDHVHTESVRIDGDSVTVDMSTKGVVTVSPKQYTDFHEGISALNILDTPEFWAKVVSVGKKAKDAFYDINPELR